MYGHVTYRRHPSFARVLVLTALALVLPLAGCGGGGSNGGSSSGAASGAASGTTSGTTTSSAPAPVPVLSVSAVLSNGLTATLAENSATVAVGGGVTYTLTLTNNTSHAITFAPLNDFSANTPVVFAVGGSVSLTASAGDPFTPPGGTTPTTGVPGGSVGPTTTLTPGQSATGSCVTGSVFTGPGKVTTTASFATEGTTGPMQQGSVGPLTLTVH